MKKLLINSKNKQEIIKLLSYVFTEHGIEEYLAIDNADTMVARNALKFELVLKRICWILIYFVFYSSF